MTRIIAGAARGLSLAVPGSGTRPTSDRVRESLFASLETMDLLEGARVLDLYAGSGALALEALSRGAHSADLVELSRPAAEVVRRNAAKVAHAGVARADVHLGHAASFLRTSAATWDLVFIDPPYDVADTDVAALLSLLAPRLDPDAVVLVERAKRSPAPDWSAAGLEPLRERNYGDTTIWWGQPSAASQSW